MRDVLTAKLPWFGLALVSFLLDIYTKWLIDQQFELHEVYQVTGFFDLVLVHNYGAAFSILADQPGWQKIFLSVVASVMSVVLTVWLIRLPKEKKMEACALALILSGALGNLYDRLTLGYVIDFLSFHYNGRAWPAFNVADIVICVGAGLLILDSFVKPKQSEKDETAKAVADE